MSTRYSIGTGNFTAAGTWGVIDATSYLNTTESAHVVTTAYSGTRTQGFTPGAITISHIGVKLAVRTGTTGTFSIHLADTATHTEVVGSLVTINTADFPVAATADLNGGWHFFKLAAPVLLVVATAYEIECKTSSSSQISLFRDVTAGNVQHALVTTTTGAPAAGDDLIVAGEYTGAGTSNSFTVTMDETATTDYGGTPTAANSLINPGLAICNKGTLTWGTTAATNYNLKVSSSIVIYSGGIMEMGTTGTPCPRDSTMKLNFDCGANVDYGLTVRNLGTCTVQGLSRTAAKNIYYCKLNTDEAANSTSLGVDTDTGWLDNDVIAVASTSRTSTDCEKGTLNGAAGASTLTVDGFAGGGGGLAVAHSGTSPTQAEVILLTRNVSIFGASVTLQAYIRIDATSTVDFDWVELYWLGSNTTNKRGVDIQTTTGSCSFQYCSRHTSTVTGSVGFRNSSASGTGVTISNNVSYDLDQSFLNLSATSGSCVVDSNIAIRNAAATSLFAIGDSGSTITNNIAVGGNSVLGDGFTITEGATTLGTFSNNVAHSNNGGGISIQASLVGGTILSCTCWRNSSSGGFVLNTSATCISNVTIKDCICFGNGTSSVAFLVANAFQIIFDNFVSNGDTTFSTPSGITFASNAVGSIVNAWFINCDFSTVTGIKTAHTQDVNVSVANVAVLLTFINTLLGAATDVASQSNITNGGYIAVQKNDQTAGQHKIFKKYGTISIETGTVHTGSQSMKMTPNNASSKLESSGVGGGFKVAVSNGATVTPTVYVYEDGTYNGNRARLIVKRNGALGISADTVLDTATAASDAAWEGLTGTTAAVTDDGTLEFVVDCDGTAGNLFVDSFSVV